MEELIGGITSEGVKNIATAKEFAFLDDIRNFAFELGKLPEVIEKLKEIRDYGSSLITSLCELIELLEKKR